MSEGVPRLSVVVCSYNRAAKLPASLDALTLQTCRNEIEVIVVDDGSELPVEALATAAGARSVTHEHNQGLAAARNTGIAEARAPVVAFTDDDCLPDKDWAEELLTAYEDRAVIAVGGEVVAARSDTFLQRYYEANPPLRPLEAELQKSTSLPYRFWLYLRSNVAPIEHTGPRGVFSLIGANFSFRREVLEAVGGFDPGIRFGGEDEDISARLRARYPNAVFWFEPDAIVEHDFDPSIRDALRRARAYGRGNARNFIKHKGWGPTIFPGPFLVLSVILVGVRSPRRLLAAITLPLVLAPRWLVRAIRHRSLSALGFAYLQFLQEAASDLGFLSGCREFRKLPVADRSG